MNVGAGLQTRLRETRLVEDPGFAEVGDLFPEVRHQQIAALDHRFELALGQKIPDRRLDLVSRRRLELR